MTSHRRLPTSSAQRHGRPEHVLSDTAPTPPKAPSGLSASERKAWKQLWSSPVSQLWTSDDHAIVVRLIRLRARLDADIASAPVALFAQTAALEDRLILTPRARRLAGIVLPDDPRRAGRNGSRRWSAKERERLLRG